MRTTLLAVIVALAAFGGTADAATISVSPTNQTVSVGDTVTVSIDVYGLGAGSAPSIGTFDFDVRFDPALLTFGYATFGNQLDILGLGDIQAATPSIPGSVNLFELSLDSATDLNNLQLPAFTLATLMFDTLAEGTSPLTVTVNALGDADGNALDANIQNGSIIVQNGTPTNATPEPSSRALVGITLIAIATALRQIRRRSPARI